MNEDFLFIFAKIDREVLFNGQHTNIKLKKAANSVTPSHFSFRMVEIY